MAITTTSLPKRVRGWLEPLVYLSSNWISLAGVVLVTTAGVFFLFLLPILWRGETGSPYIGILIFMILPMAFFLGLGLIPCGVYLTIRRQRRKGQLPHTFPPLDIHSPQLRRLAAFVGVTTLSNLIMASQFGYSAVNYMDTVEFCGLTCHTVMKPEYTAYQNSPHSRVDCVKCHIGPGASWFVRSKLSGAYQVYAVTLGVYDRPIPTPVRNLRPARETCEACHWPQKYGGDRVKVIPKFGDDENNTPIKTVLLLHIGGGASGPGIHGVHLGQGVTVRYRPSDESRQTIPWVEYTDGEGKATVYQSADAKPEDMGKLPVRVMDCMDCHNRPSHTFQLPERALDTAFSDGEISATLPFAKKQALEILKQTYSSTAEARQAIPAAFIGFYREQYPTVYSSRRAEIEGSARALLAVFSRNVFPEMKVSWGSYPNNLGHTDFPGCFRCHDDSHASSNGKKITQDCSACHNVLAVEESSPKVLSDLGIAATSQP